MSRLALLHVGRHARYPVAIAICQRPERVCQLSHLDTVFSGIDGISTLICNFDDVDRWYVLKDDHRQLIKKHHPRASVKTLKSNYPVAASSVLESADKIDSSGYRDWMNFRESMKRQDIQNPRFEAMVHLLAQALKFKPRGRNTIEFSTLHLHHDSPFTKRSF